jgi:hypothetical protein
MDKQKALYIGVGIFLLFVIINSTKKVELKEVADTDYEITDFDYSILPTDLQPPVRVDDTAITSDLAKPKNLSLNGVKPRFDNK